MIEGHIGYRLLLLGLILALNGFFAAAEVSLLSVRRSKLHQMAESGIVGAQAALSLHGCFAPIVDEANMLSDGSVHPPLTTLGEDGLQVAVEQGAGVLEILFGVGFGGGEARKRFVEYADYPLLFTERRDGYWNSFEFAARQFFES